MFASLCVFFVCVFFACVANFVQYYAQLNEASTLSWSTRIKGFVICFVIGILLSILGSVMLFLHLGLTKFAVLYTFGNIMSMARYTEYYKIDCI